MNGVSDKERERSCWQAFSPNLVSGCVGHHVNHCSSRTRMLSHTPRERKATSAPKHACCGCIFIISTDASVAQICSHLLKCYHIIVCVMHIVFLCLACRRSFSLALRPTCRCATRPWREGREGWYIARIRSTKSTKSRNTNPVKNMCVVTCLLILFTILYIQYYITKQKIAYMSLNMVFSCVWCLLTKAAPFVFNTSG